MISAVLVTQRVVWVMKATRSGSGTSRVATSSTVCTRTMLWAPRPSYLDLLVALVTDHHDRVALGGEASRRNVNLGDQRTGGIDRAQMAGRRVLVHRGGDAVGREDDHLALGHLVLLLDENRTALGEFLDHVLVVDDLLAHVNRRAVEIEGALDRLYGPVNARAIAARGGEQDPPWCDCRAWPHGSRVAAQLA